MYEKSWTTGDQGSSLFKELRNLCVLFRRTSFLSEVFHELKVFLML